MYADAFAEDEEKEPSRLLPVVLAALKRQSPHQATLSSGRYSRRTTKRMHLTVHERAGACKMFEQ